MSDGTALTFGEPSPDEIGFRLQRAKCIELMKRHSGMKAGEAHMFFERFEHALDCAVQFSAPSGGQASEAMSAGFEAFLSGPTP